MTRALEVKKDGLSQLQDGSWKFTLKVHANDMPTELMQAPMGTRYGMAFKLIADDESFDHTEPEEKTEGERAVQQAGILCQKPEFQNWIAYHDIYGGYMKVGPHDSVRSVTKGGAIEYVHRACGVESRAEFATNPEALARWKKLAGEYMDYQRHGV